MINLDKLQKNTMIAIGVIVLYIVISVSRWVFDQYLTDTVEDILSVVHIPLYFFIMLFLYYYIRLVEKQKMWLSPIVGIIFARIYSTIHNFYPFWHRYLTGDNSNLEAIFFKEFLPNGAPGLIVVICDFILAVQLIRNHSGQQKRNIRYLGICLLIPFISGITYLFLMEIFRAWELLHDAYPGFVNLAGLVPYILMLNLYISSIRRNTRNSVIATEG